MKLYNINGVRDWDAYTIDHEPISSIDLMERAATRLCERLLLDYGHYDNFIILCGPGNNGGDGLVLARLLHQKGIEAMTYAFSPSKKFSDDAKQNLKRHPLTKINGFDSWLNDTSKLKGNTLIVDALFGSGLARPLDGEFKALVEQINSTEHTVVSVDIPSGLPGDSVVQAEAIVVQADKVYTFQVPKRSLLIPEHATYVKSFEVLDIGLHADYNRECPWHFVTESDLALPERSRFNHKGSHGRVAILGGSKGMGGAIILSTMAALRSGAGLCTAVIPSRLEKSLHTSIPDATLILDPEENHLTTVPNLQSFDAIAVGPGLGKAKATVAMLDNLLQDSDNQLVIDADALNIIAENNWQSRIPKGSIITPHPKEFTRLFGATKHSFEAYDLQLQMSQELGITIVRKGAHTSTSSPQGELYFNSTGNEGMAKGGSGDVLTGVITALLGQGLEPIQAAISGVYYHGKAGDLVASQRPKRTMLASDLVLALFKQ